METYVKTLFILSVLATAAAVPAAAQSSSAAADSVCKTDSEGREVCITGVTVRRRPGLRDSLIRLMPGRHDSAMMKRAALGIEMRPTGTRRDTLGIFVASVTPRGPAEMAGIYEGDRIAAINGVDLRAAAADIEDSYTNGLAAHRLSREVQKLTPGTRVNLRVYSGGRYRDVALTTGRASDLARQANRFNFRVPANGRGFQWQGPVVVPSLPSMPRAPSARGILYLTPG